jgi:hypothetical protein
MLEDLRYLKRIHGFREDFQDYLVSRLQNNKNIIWVASYPKSGNTWLLNILSALYCSNASFENFILGTGGKGRGVKYVYLNSKRIDFRNDKARFIKTHYKDYPAHLFPNYLENRITNFGFIHLYRHPLDILLSALNYFYHRNEEQYFFDGKAHSVDELKANSQLDSYVEKFIETLEIGNSSQMEKLCGGNWLDHTMSWRNKLSSKGDTNISTSIRYEGMLENTFEYLLPLAHLLGKDDKDLELAIKLASQTTRLNGKFFWKQKYGNYFDYLNRNQIEKFNLKYKDILRELGY